MYWGSSFCQGILLGSYTGLPEILCSWKWLQLWFVATSIFELKRCGFKPLLRYILSEKYCSKFKFHDTCVKKNYERVLKLPPTFLNTKIGLKFSKIDRLPDQFYLRFLVKIWPDYCLAKRTYHCHISVCKH